MGDAKDFPPETRRRADELARVVGRLLASFRLQLRTHNCCCSGCAERKLLVAEGTKLLAAYLGTK